MKNFLTQTNSFEEWSRNRGRCNKARSEISSLRSKVDGQNFSKFGISPDVSNYFPSLQQLANIGAEVDDAKKAQSKLEEKVAKLNNSYKAACIAEEKHKQMVKRVAIGVAIVVAFIIFKLIL